MLGPKNEDVIRLIGLAYQSVDDPENWNVFLEELANAAGLQVTALSFRESIDSPIDVALSHAIEQDLLVEYAEDVDETDPFAPVMTSMPVGRVVDHGRSVVPRDELLGTKYHDWMTRCGGDDSLTAMERAPRRGDTYLSGYTQLGELTTDAQVELFETIAPHVFHAVQLARQMTRLKVDKRIGREALARADFGCVVVNGEARVDWMNHYARAATERADTLELDGDQLRASHPSGRDGLASAIRAALGVDKADGEPASEPAPIFKLPRIGEGHPIEVLVSPLQPLGHPLFGELRGALVLFSDTEHLDEGIAGRLEQLYDLTPTEAEVAQWLMAGSSTNDIADIFGNSIHTIRTHVKRILTKCDASSQAELVGLLQRSLVRLA
jgi:DNA-binding CsgD family transcriptional regulator